MPAFSSLPAKHPSASDSCPSWFGVQVLPLVAVSPALPQILTIELPFFCLWHGSTRLTAVHSPWQGRESSFPQPLCSQSGSAQMCVRTAICAWPIKSTNAMTGGGEKVMIHKDCNRDTSLGWPWDEGARRPRGSEMSPSLGHRGSPMSMMGDTKHQPVTGWAGRTTQIKCPLPCVKNTMAEQSCKQSHFLCRFQEPQDSPHKRSWSTVSISVLQITIKYSLRSNPPVNNHWASIRHLGKVLAGRSAEINKKCSLPELQEQEKIVSRAAYQQHNDQIWV